MIINILKFISQLLKLLDFDESAQDLLSYLDGTSNSKFYPKNNKELCLRLLHYRHKRETNETAKIILQNQAKNIFNGKKY